ncbi:uncharacterized protein TRUGW13939_04637 [Talaromyces rugulosus]|uniref:Conidiation-specific protein 13 n=1 Tax=Talaromyces rugulosus TaxID=121627 RepID=A0A7H8QXK4_TALRU|nr:uncharacterized protein TRUGW13939_04637 [Talaromyces rugulosus]QKX57523.1 hypothetical protein TRUGW13939_04637 [Talaromyces rugulosus]
MAPSSLLFGMALAASGSMLVNGQALDKPPLSDNLDYLADGNNANLAVNQGTYQQWEAGTIPADCKSLGQEEGKDPNDFEVYDVTYGDCGDPWVFCRHKDSTTTIDTTINTFSQLPVAMRSWVRHVLTMPGDDSAYNANGNIAFFGGTSGSVDVALHETGHSLDLLGAYGDQLSTSQDWLDSYDQDSNVPDNYAQTSQIENVAQNTVVGVYDKVVPGGFPGVQPDYNNIIHQYTTLQSKAGDQILPGGQCDRHLDNSEPVSTSDDSASVVHAANTPNVSFKGKYTNIVKNFREFNTKEHCAY